MAASCDTIEQALHARGGGRGGTLRLATTQRRRTVHGRGRWLIGVVLLAGLIATAACEASDPTADASEPHRTLGLLRAVPDDDHAALVAELRVRGWSLGSNLRLLPGDPDTIYGDTEEARQALAAWLREDVDVVIAFSTPFAEMLAEQAPSTPGLFVLNDPVAAGLVTDPDRPDGSLTGVTFRTPADRTLDLARQVVGDVDRLGYLWPADDPAVPGHRRAVEIAARDLGIELLDAPFEDEKAVVAAIDELASAEVDLVFIASSTATIRALDAIETALAEHDLPAVANTDFAHFAVLVLTPDGAELRRQLARQAARLLAGAPVSAVPVEDPRKFVVIINRSRILELGLPDVPSAVLQQADVVR